MALTPSLLRNIERHPPAGGIDPHDLAHLQWFMRIYANLNHFYPSALDGLGSWRRSWFRQRNLLHWQWQGYKRHWLIAGSCSTSGLIVLRQIWMFYIRIDCSTLDMTALRQKWLFSVWIDCSTSEVTVLHQKWLFLIEIVGVVICVVLWIVMSVCPVLSCLVFLVLSCLGFCQSSAMYDWCSTCDQRTLDGKSSTRHVDTGRNMSRTDRQKTQLNS